MLHLARAAFRAIAVRRLALSFAALILPPLDPPSFPSATAAGFFSPLSITFWIRSNAALFGSVLGRLGMAYSLSQTECLGGEMAGRRGYRTVNLPVKLVAKPVPIRMSAQRADTLQEIVGEMTLYRGVKLLDIMEAIYLQGCKDGARATFDEIDRNVSQAKKAIPHRAPGRPRKR